MFCSYVWADIGETYNKKSGGTISTCWFHPKVLWIKCLKHLGNLIEYNSWTATFIHLDGDCWLDFSIVLHLSTTYNIAVKTREVSCHVIGLNMEWAIWFDTNIAYLKPKTYAEELYSVSTEPYLASLLWNKNLNITLAISYVWQKSLQKAKDLWSLENLFSWLCYPLNILTLPQPAACTKFWVKKKDV